jgi:hypothetical protein
VCESVWQLVPLLFTKIINIHFHVSEIGREREGARVWEDDFQKNQRGREFFQKTREDRAIHPTTTAIRDTKVRQRGRGRGRIFLVECIAGQGKGGESGREKADSFVVIECITGAGYIQGVQEG